MGGAGQSSDNQTILSDDLPKSFSKVNYSLAIRSHLAILHAEYLDKYQISKIAGRIHTYNYLSYIKEVGMKHLTVANMNSFIITMMGLLFFIAYGCVSPEIVMLKETENVEQGKTKKLVAEIKTTDCVESIKAFYQKTGSTINWIQSGTPIKMDNKYVSEIPGSNLFIANDVYEFKWEVEYKDQYPSFISWAMGTCASETKSLRKTSSFTVAAPLLVLTANPNPVNIPFGTSKYFTLTRSGTYTGPLNISSSPMTGITVVPTSNPMTGASQVIAVTATAATIGGPYTLNIGATAGNSDPTVNATIPISIYVTPAPTFSMTVSPTQIIVPRGGNASVNLIIAPQNGFTGIIMISTVNPISLVTIIPSGQFQVNISSTSPQTIPITIHGLTQIGQQFVTFRGSSGGQEKTTQLNIFVN